MKLSHAVKFNEHVNVACLPREEDVFEPGTTCVTAGWGHTVEGGFYFILFDKRERVERVVKAKIMRKDEKEPPSERKCVCVRVCVCVCVPE